jgi:hypothetical protein
MRGKQRKYLRFAAHCLHLIFFFLLFNRPKSLTRHTGMCLSLLASPGTDIAGIQGPAEQDKVRRRHAEACKGGGGAMRIWSLTASDRVMLSFSFLQTHIPTRAHPEGR